ncbi:MAG: DUF2442 domain-containing protein [Elusimicrobia bacterium]|nr:DUF2442 domain-containing protein [Elusimicrobiota bacterium]
MNTLPSDFAASRVWFDDANLWVALRDGRQVSTPLAYFPRLLKATPVQRNKFELSGGGVGIHWDELDEDISVPGLLLGIGDVTLLKKSA